MKKLLFASLIVTTSLTCLAQYDSRPTKSRFYNSNKSTFKISKGDVLVYHVNNNGDEYDFIVTIKTFDSMINFGYTMPQKQKAANIIIRANAVKNAVKYNNYFDGADKTFTNESTVWLSQKNYKEIAPNNTGEAQMDMGNGLQNFKKTDASTMKITYLGEEKIITYHKALAEGGNEIWVLNNKTNPLIVKMNLGWTIELKEVKHIN